MGTFQDGFGVPLGVSFFDFKITKKGVGDCGDPSEKDNFKPIGCEYGDPSKVKSGGHKFPHPNDVH